MRFEAQDAGTTRVEFEHRHLNRHRDGAAEYKAMLEAPEGWSQILNEYV